MYEVSEDVPFGESLRLATFTVYLKKDSSETNCSCRLFEFRGIVCRHQIAVLMKKKDSSNARQVYFKKMEQKCEKMSH